jgi:ribosomal protein L11
MKIADLNSITIEAAMRIIAGTARSMGIEITN